MNNFLSVCKIAVLGLGACLSITSAALAEEILDYKGNDFDNSFYGLNKNYGKSLDIILNIPVSVKYTGNVDYDYQFSAVNDIVITPVGGSFLFDYSTIATYDVFLQLVDGLPISWDVGATDTAGHSAETFLINGLSNDLVEGPSGVVSANNVFGKPGTWSISAGVPEPSQWALMLIGVYAIGVALRASTNRPRRASMLRAHDHDIGIDEYRRDEAVVRE